MRSSYVKAVKILCVALAALMVAGSLASSSMAQRETNNGLALRPGIVFDPAVTVAYVMTPEGIAAVDLSTGAKRWTTRAAAKPLAVSGNLLISQAEPRTQTSPLELVVLDTQERGAAKVRSVTELPPGVRVAIGQTIDGKFSVEARQAGSDAIVTWSFERLPLRGMVENPDAEGSGTRSLQLSEGALQMDLRTGRIANIGLSRALRPPNRTWTVAANANLPSNLRASSTAAPQYESADRRHVASSERVADDRVFEKYRWTIFDRTTGARLGEFRSHVSFAPFVVRDSTLVYETTPYVREGRKEPAKLRGISLSNGRELWSVEVRELVFRGSFPP